MIGGNIEATVQIRNSVINDIGERVNTWVDVQQLYGFLDYQSGDSRYNTYSSKIPEFTHVFICDYCLLDSRIHEENATILINDSRYDILAIDNPMNLNKHLEIFLNFIGGQNGE